MANIARLGVLLGLDSAEFSKGIDQANNKLHAFGQKIAANAATVATVAVAAFTAAAQQALAYADEIADVAKANDVTINSIIKLNDALAQSGGKADGAGKLLASFTKFVDDAATGSDAAQASFIKIGVSLKDLSTLSMEQLFAKAIQGISAIEDPLTRNANAMDMFGKAAKGVDFVGLTEGMTNGAGATAAQTQGLLNAAEMYDRVAQSGRDFMLMLSSELGPPLKTTIDYLQTMIEKGTLVQSVFRSLFTNTALWVGDFAFELSGLTRNLTAYFNAAAAFAKINIYSTAEERSAGKRILEENTKARVKALEDRAKFKQEIETPFIVAVKVDEPGTKKRDVAPGKQATSAAASAAAKAAAKKDSDFKKQIALEHHGWLASEEARLERLRIDDMFTQGNKLLGEKQVLESQTLARAHELFVLNQNINHLSEDDLQLQRDKLQIANEYEDAVKVIRANDALNLEAQTRGLEEQLKLQQQALDLAYQRRDMSASSKAGSFAKGFDESMGKAFRDLPTEMQKGQMAFESVFKNMNSAIDNFVKTGKLNFKSFAQSVIQDIIAMELKAQALGLLRMALGAFGFSSGSTATPMLKFADGGDPPINRASMVGERGPELFVPKSAGTIIPNHQLSLGGSGGGTTINYNAPYIAAMSAIDTQSGLQFLAKNKQAVWATYQSANRSMPMSR